MSIGFSTSTGLLGGGNWRHNSDTYRASARLPVLPSLVLVILHTKPHPRHRHALPCAVIMHHPLLTTLPQPYPPSQTRPAVRILPTPRQSVRPMANHLHFQLSKPTQLHLFSMAVNPSHVTSKVCTSHSTDCWIHVPLL